MLLALIGVILGIIAGVAPDKLHKDKASHVSQSRRNLPTPHCSKVTWCVVVDVFVGR